ncbi:MAG: GspH/FimT family pseudopilin [Gammaproteobacteria bacterium]|nr:GspH/FimT family pseudopilin [Gammaproteobacteria bacterium]
MHRSRSYGFTLIELMVVLALAAIMLGLAVPNMRQFILNNRLTSGANDLLRAVNQARSEAIKRQGIVTLCATDEPDEDEPACSGNAFSGWVVFVDGDADGAFDNGEVKLSSGSTASGVRVSSDHDGILCYAPSGFAGVDCGGLAPTQNIVLCDARFDAGDETGANAGRALIVTTTGRGRVTRDHTEVATALAATGGSCS